MRRTKTKFDEVTLLLM